MRTTFPDLHDELCHCVRQGSMQKKNPPVLIGKSNQPGRSDPVAGNLVRMPGVTGARTPYPIPRSSMRSSGVPQVRQMTAWQSPQTKGSGTRLAQVGQYNSAVSMGMARGGACPRPGTYLAAAMESTFRFLPASSRVPTTVTFLAANFSGVFWSLSTYDFLALASYRTYLPFMPFTHSMTHLASLPIFMSVWSALAHMLSVMTPVKVWGPAAKAMAAAAKTTAICFFISGFSRAYFRFPVL